MDVKRVKGWCAMLATLVMAILLLPVTARAAEAEEGYDERALEVYQELMDAVSNIGWLEEEIQVKGWYDHEKWYAENASDVAGRVPYGELSDVDRFMYEWTFHGIMVLKDSDYLPWGDIMESSDSFYEWNAFKSYSGNIDEALDAAYRKVVDFQYDYMLSHGNEPYDFTKFIQNDAIVVGSGSTEPGPSQGVGQEPSDSGALEPDPGLVLPSGTPSQSQVRDQEVPEGEREGGGGSPWEAVMDRLAGLMLTLLVLAVSGIALAVVIIRRKKKGD